MVVKKKYLTEFYFSCKIARVMKMEEKVRQGYLLDFYGELLTQRQREICKAFIYDDLSQTEIAEAAGISRQGVFDILRRCNRALEGYESRLHLLERFWGIREKVDEIHALTKETGEIPHAMARIRELSSRILEEL